MRAQFEGVAASATSESSTRPRKVQNMHCGQPGRASSGAAVLMEEGGAPPAAAAGSRAGGAGGLGEMSVSWELTEGSPAQTGSEGGGSGVPAAYTGAPLPADPSSCVLISL